MPHRTAHLDTAAMTLMVVLCFAWGLQQVAIKVANAGISPVLQAGLRSGGAVLLLLVWSAWRGIRLFRSDGSLWPGLLAGALFASEFALIYAGLGYTTASRSVVFLYTAPFVVAVGVHFLVPGEHMRRLQAVGLVCAFGGIVAAFAEGLALPSGEQWIGDAMILAAAVLWGATTVLIKASCLRRVPAAKTLFYQLAVSAAALPVASLIMGERGIIDITPVVALSLAYQTVLVAFASYLAWFWLISNYSASRLSAFAFLTPLFGVLAGGVLLSEPITPLLALALLLVGAGIYLVNRPHPAA